MELLYAWLIIVLILALIMLFYFLGFYDTKNFLLYFLVILAPFTYTSILLYSSNKRSNLTSEESL